MTWKNGGTPRPEAASKSPAPDGPTPDGHTGRRALTARELAAYEMELIVGGLHRLPDKPPRGG